MTTLQHALADFMKSRRPHTTAQKEQGDAKDQQTTDAQTIVQRIAHEVKERTTRRS